MVLARGLMLRRTAVVPAILSGLIVLTSVLVGGALVRLGVVCGDMPVRQPDGSCAKPFQAGDAAANRVSFRAYLAVDPAKVSYESTNQTNQPRSVDARQVVVTDAKGLEADCFVWSSSGFGPLEETQPRGGNMGEECTFAKPPTLPVVVSYQGVRVARAEWSPAALLILGMRH